MAALVLANATAGPCSSPDTTLSTSASKSSAGYTALISPHANASAAGSRSASRAIRNAPIRPIAAAISAEAPPSGIRPILVKASMKNALSEANTRSQARASETPTPAAAPRPLNTRDEGTRQRGDRPAPPVGCQDELVAGAGTRHVVGAHSRSG